MNLIGTPLFLLLGGFALSLGWALAGLLCCLTIIGIPMAIADFKMVPISLAPLGKEIVSTRNGAFDRTL